MTTGARIFLAVALLWLGYLAWALSTEPPIATTDQEKEVALVNDKDVASPRESTTVDVASSANCRGTVMDRQGKAITSGQVSLYTESVQKEATSRKLLATATIDSVGKFAAQVDDVSVARLVVTGDGVVESEVRFVSVPCEKVPVVVMRRFPVNGKVVATQGLVPVGNVVAIANSLAYSQTATTSSNGEFSFVGLPEGSYTVWAYGKGWATPRAKLVLPVDEVILMAEAAAPIVVEVLLSGADTMTSSAVQSAVQLLGEDSMLMSLTTEHGRATFLGVVAGEYFVHATASGYLSESVTIQHTEVARDIVLRLHPGDSISGIVLSVDGVAVEGATVSIAPSASARQHLANTTGETIVILPVSNFGGNNNNWAPMGELGVVRGPIPFPPIFQKGWQIAVPRNNNTSIVPGHSQFVSQGMVSTTTLSGSDGNFIFRGLRPGKYELTLRHSAYAVGNAVVHTNAEPVIVRLLPGKVLRGSVTSKEGAPIEGARVSVASGDSRFVDWIRTDAQGRFETSPVVGVVQLRIQANGYATQLRKVNLNKKRPNTEKNTKENTKENLAIVLVAAQSSIAGKITSKQWKPIADAKITVQATTPPKMTASKADGTFVIDELPKGTWQILVSHPDWQTKTVAADTERPLEVVLLRGAVITGQVQDADSGAPLRVRVTARHSKEKHIAAHTDVDGRYFLRGLASGQWQVQVSHQGYGVKTSKVTVANQQTVTHNISLRAPIHLEGTVLNQNGERVQGATVRAGDVSSQTDDQGVFVLRQVAAGEVVLQATLDASSASLELTLSPGDTFTTLELRLE